MKLRADIILKEMARTFVRKNKRYGDNWEIIGKVLTALYPKGVKLTTHEDFVMFVWVAWKIGKLTRFTQTGQTHQDSIHDDGVYGSMIEAYLPTIKKGKHTFVKPTPKPRKK